MTATVSVKEALSCHNYFLTMHNPNKTGSTFQIEIDEQVQVNVLNYHIQITESVMEYLYMLSNKEASKYIKICKEIEENVNKTSGKKISPYNSVNKKFAQLCKNSLNIARTLQEIAGFNDTDESSQDYSDFWANMIKSNKNEKRIYGKSNVLKLIG